MLLTQPQITLFWREWSAACRRMGWTEKSEQEAQRKALLARAGFTSLTEVDKLDGFDAVLKEVRALNAPSDLDSQLRLANMPRTRLIYACRHKADEAYIVAIAASPRFKSDDWTAMPLEDMKQLRDTLCDRAVEQHRADTTARRRSVRPRPTQPATRLSFPDLVTATETDADPF